MNPSDISNKPGVTGKPRGILLLVAIIGAILGIGIVSYFVMSGNGGDATVDNALMQMAEEVNNSLPTMVDAETRLDATTAGPGKSFIYVYSLVNRFKQDINIPSLQETMRPKILENYRTNEKMKYFRDENVELHYRYNDKNGALLFEIVVSPKDF